MYEKKNILAVVLARSGSKRLPNKNKKLLANKPLISWTIDAASNSKYLDEICVSTDDDDILSIVSEHTNIKGIRRPKNLATDESKSTDATLDVLNKYNDSFNYIMLLQPTSPLRTSVDIDKAIKLIIEQNKSSIVSISKIKGDDRFGFVKVGSRYLQESEIKNKISKGIDRFYPNGAIYVIENEKFLITKQFYNDDTIGFLMPETRSIDIDDINQFKMAERYLLNEKDD